MRKNKNNISWLALTVITAFLLQACDKAENYYEKLDAQPEVITNYRSVYGVGDTLVLQGRLNPKNGLTVRIGDVEADVSDIRSITYKRSDASNAVFDSIEQVNIVITEGMGIGRNRKVAVTSAGFTVQCPAIEIIEGINSGYLSDPVQLVQHARLSPIDIPLFCQNGKGTVFYWSLSGKGLVRIDKDGSSSTVLEPGVLSDNEGSFIVTTFHAGGVDPQERYVYFSATTTDGKADNGSNEIYRLCRYDMQNRVFTTLNRSSYPKTQNERTLEVFQPFEGNIGVAKLFAADGIYPASNGNVFLWLPQSSTIGRLDASGRLTYLFRLGASVPPIYNPTTGRNYTTNEIRLMLPGTNISTSINTLVRGVLPDENLLFARTGNIAAEVTQIDLTNAAVLHSVSPEYASISRNEPLYITGSFDILNADPGRGIAGTPDPLFGYMPLPDAKVLILYYQELNSDTFPALATLNFKEKAGRRYSPGKVVRNNYRMMNRGADIMLNYDEEGMIYMTANNGSVIIKTQTR
ncbi:hypothetical protein [Desertivirga xinjiangensis]|uniref:hypothetical protein n=1 Tax=Desertivirga xinjiangensis TaxID=539206 RepID=UPI002108AFD2|nr:hypothetical protein [Pedobacter xinjiangensis]